MATARILVRSEESGFTFTIEGATLMEVWKDVMDTAGVEVVVVGEAA